MRQSKARSPGTVSRELVHLEAALDLLGIFRLGKSMCVVQEMTCHTILIKDYVSFYSSVRMAEIARKTNNSKL